MLRRMDDRLLRKFLCAHCIEKIELVREHARALAAARESRAKLDQLAGIAPKGKKAREEYERDIAALRGLSSDDDDELAVPGFVDAIATTKKKLGIAAAQPQPRSGMIGAPRFEVPRDLLIACIRGDINPDDLAKRVGTTRVTVSKRIRDLIGPGSNTEKWKAGYGFSRKGKRAILLLEKGFNPAAVRKGSPHERIPRERLIACIRGDVSPTELEKELGVTHGTVAQAIHNLIGPSEGELCKRGIGHMRGGKRAIIALAKKDKSIHIGEVRDELQHARRTHKKHGGGPKPMGINEKDLVRFINNRVSAAELAQKYGCSKQNIYLRVARMRQRFGVPSPRERDNQLETEAADMRAAAEEIVSSAEQERDQQPPPDPAEMVAQVLNS
jgi:hypothetical protein